LKYYFHVIIEIRIISTFHLYITHPLKAFSMLFPSDSWSFFISRCWSRCANLSTFSTLLPILNNWVYPLIPTKWCLFSFHKTVRNWKKRHSKKARHILKQNMWKRINQPIVRDFTRFQSFSGSIFIFFFHFTQDQKASTNPLSGSLHIGQSFREEAHRAQEHKWPQGRVTTETPLSLQTLHNVSG
jgi:hypothetical protein